MRLSQEKKKSNKKEMDEMLVLVKKDSKQCQGMAQNSEWYIPKLFWTKNLLQ